MEPFPNLKNASTKRNIVLINFVASEIRLTPECLHCSGCDEDKVKHKLAYCPAFAVQHRVLVTKLGPDISLPRIVATILGGDESGRSTSTSPLSRRRRRRNGRGIALLPSWRCGVATGPGVRGGLCLTPAPVIRQSPPDHDYGVT